MSFNNISLINLNSQFNPFYSSITIDSSGNVGVGKTNPTTNLDVSGNINLSGIISGSGANLISLNATNITSGVLSVNRGGTGASTLTLGSILVGNGTTTVSQPTNLVWNNTSNRLGIGKNDPGTTLDVNGIITSTGLICSGGPVVIDTTNNVNIDSGVLYIDGTKNNVGIGTILPDSNTKLHVSGNARIEGNLKVNGTFEQVNTVQGTTEQLKITNDGTGPAVIINQTGAQAILDIQDDSATCFKIFDGGHVGIGTVTKIVDVDISGNLKLSGIITGSGAGLSSLNISNALNGTLSVTRGGTGVTTLVAGQLLVGNDTTILQSSNLTWNNSSNQLGIGTTNPLSLLDINATNYTGAILTLDAGIINATSQMARSIGKPLMKIGKTSYSTTAGDYYGIGFGYSPTSADFNCAEIGTIITNVAGKETGDIVFSTRPDTSNVAATERMRILSGGNVGIGITNPSVPLSVYTVNNTGGIKIIGGTNASGDQWWLGYGHNGGATPSADANDRARVGVNISAAGSGRLFFTTGVAGAQAERMRIDETGYVGIGTTSPTQILQVGGGGRLRIANSNSDYTMIGSSDADVSTNTTIVLSGTDRASYNGQIDYVARSTGSHIFYTTASATERMRIASNGNVGIGTTDTATYKLNVNGSQFINNQLKFSDRYTDLDNFPCNKITLWNNGFGFGISTSTLDYFSPVNHRFYTGSSPTLFGTERMRIASNGAVGIQTTGEGITNNYLAAGALTIGNTTQDYGGGIAGWNTNTAGFLMECLNNTEIAIHDSGNSVHSFMRYTNNGNFRIGRDMGHGVANTTIAGTLTCDGTSTLTGRVGIGKAPHATFACDVNGSINCTLFSGSGASLTNLNATNISDGTLTVARGGTGVSTLVANQLLVGNAAGALIQSNNLTWTNSTNTLSATNFVGSGAGLTSLTATNITGTLSITNGGTGVATLVANQLLVGNATGALIQSNNLTWTNSTNTLSATNFVGSHSGSGAGLTSLPAANITGTLPIANGGTGVATLVANQLLVGNAAGALIQSPNLTWDNTNFRLGIGITNPSNILQVGGGGRLRISNGATDYTLIGSIDADGVNNTKILLSAIDRGGTILGGNIEYYASAIGQHIFYTTSSTTERMRIGNNGNVSIGTTDTATYKLNVNGTVFVGQINLPITGACGIIWGTDAALGRAFAAGNYSDSAAAGDIILRSAAANKLILQSGNGAGAITIATTNNVGIGKTDPGTKLDVVGTVTATLFSGSGASLTLLNATNISTGTLTAAQGGTGCTSLSTTFFDTTGGILSLKSGASQWTTLNSNIYFNTGNVGIGITNPNYKLHVDDGILFVGDSLYLNNSSLNTANNYYLLFDNTYNAIFGSGIAANKIRLMNDTSNNILAGFGMENNSIAYHSGTLGSHTFYSGTSNTNYGTGRFQIDQLGNITCTGDFAAFTSISDKRLKTNIIKLDSSIDIIKKLNPVKFNWKYNDFIIDNKQGKEDVGFIAQEIEQIIPLASGEYKVINSEETYKNIKYERIIPYLVKSIQELIDKVERLEQEIQYLKQSDYSCV